MANEIVCDVPLMGLMRENGPISMRDMAPTKNSYGLRLLKGDTKGFAYIVRVPAAVTVGTGYTVKLLLTDDGRNADDLGKVAVLGINFKALTSGTDNLDMSSGAGTEATGNLTLNATSQVVVEVSIAITKANADGLDAGGWGLFQVRRIGTNTSDTCLGHPLLCGIQILNT